VIRAKDTPNFIANHLGLHGVAAIVRAVESGRYSIDEADAMTGPAIGRPGSATFRTMDIAGLDVLAHVMTNLEDRLPGDADRAWFRQPALVTRLLERGALGEKAGRGFYERRRDASGASAVFTLDPATLDYHPPEAHLPSIAAAATTTPAPASGRSSSVRTGWASSCARRWRPHCSTPRAWPTTSPIRSTTSTA
jgi:3-hydroxyacyl-CoA dehydrogenase